MQHEPIPKNVPMLRYYIETQSVEIPHFEIEIASIFNHGTCPGHFVVLSSARVNVTRSFMDDLESYVKAGLHALGRMQADSSHRSFTLVELRDAIRKSVGVDLSSKHDPAIKIVLMDLEQSNPNKGNADTCSALPAGWVHKK